MAIPSQLQRFCADLLRWTPLAAPHTTKQYEDYIARLNEVHVIFDDNIRQQRIGARHVHAALGGSGRRSKFSGRQYTRAGPEGRGPAVADRVANVSLRRSRRIGAVVGGGKAR